MTNELIREQDGAIGRLTIARPEKRNALTVDVLLGLIEALAEWAARDEVRAVIITGAGEKAFSGGFDVSAIPTRANLGSAKAFQEQNPVDRSFSAVRDFPYPVIAMINGVAIGAGFGLTMACDLRIAADDIKMGIPPARLGLVYYHEGLRQIVEAIGMARAREIFFTGRMYGPDEIREMGLVHHLVPRAGLENFTLALAREIAGNAPLSLKGLKRIFNLLGSGQSLGPESVREADLLMAQSFLSEDAREGQRAFLEKRAPVFKGK